MPVPDTKAIKLLQNVKNVIQFMRQVREIETLQHVAREPKRVKAMWQATKYENCKTHLSLLSYQLTIIAEMTQDKIRQNVKSTNSKIEMRNAQRKRERLCCYAWKHGMAKAPKVFQRFSKSNVEMHVTNLVHNAKQEFSILNHSSFARCWHRANVQFP